MRTPPWRAAAAVLPSSRGTTACGKEASLGETAVEHERHERLHHLAEGPDLPRRDGQFLSELCARTPLFPARL
eukprot:1203200-Lingulodinium_polyedra.AAC.1